MNSYDDQLLCEGIYNDFQGVLRRMAISFHIPAADVDDLVQETFISYFDHYSLNWNQSQKKAALVKILRRKTIDYHRKYGKYDMVSLDDTENIIPETEFHVSQPSADPANIILSDASFKHIVQEIENLKPEWRELAVLYFIEQCTISEICEILNISKPVCCTRLYRIRCHLKETLGPDYNI